MIYSLDELPEILISSSGWLIQSLLTLQRAGLPVSDALVLSIEEFARFRSTGGVDNNQIDNIISRCATGQFACAKQISIRSVSAIPYIGLEDKQIARKNYTSIRYMIEKIYRSWSDERALASRTTKYIVGEDGFPSLLIEPYFEHVSTLLTRSGASGEATNASNYKINVNNKIATFNDIHLQMLAEVDTLLKMPTKISFVDTVIPSILSLSHQPITLKAYQHCLDEYVSRGILTPIEFLRRVDPKIIGALSDYDLVAKNVILSAEGRSLSAGWAVGPVTFDVNKIHKSGQTPILVTRDLSRGKLEAVCNFAGVIGIDVGMTSHLAVACRKFGIPALGIENTKIDLKTNCLSFDNGYKIPEHSYSLINCHLKVARFATDSELEPIYSTLVNPDYLNTIVQALSYRNDIESFKPLCMRDQVHLANIRRILRLIGRTE